MRHDADGDGVVTLEEFTAHATEAFGRIDANADGQIEQAEALFQELIEVFPSFAWGYIKWGDQYWMSDWSYQHAPDYDRAESIYRQALANSDLVVFQLSLLTF